MLKMGLAKTSLHDNRKFLASHETKYSIHLVYGHWFFEKESSGFLILLSFGVLFGMSCWYWATGCPFAPLYVGSLRPVNRWVLNQRFRSRSLRSLPPVRHLPTYIHGIWGQVIPGWDMAMMKLSQGEKAILTIPASLAYGTKGYGKLGGVKSLLKLWMPQKTHGHVFGMETKNMMLLGVFSFMYDSIQDLNN